MQKCIFWAQTIPSDLYELKLLISSHSFVMHSRRRNICQHWNFVDRLTICQHCNEIMWLDEKVRDSPAAHPKFNLSCQGGQVSLPYLPNAPVFLELQFSNTIFKEHIRTYNSMLSFTLMGGKVDHSVLDGRGPYTFSNQWG